jgi:hypothetical protein
MVVEAESAQKRRLVSDGTLVMITLGSLIATAGSLIALEGPFEWEKPQLPYVRASALVSLIALAVSGTQLIRRASN